MNRSISDLLTANYHSGLHRSACWNCSRREDCPYSCDRIFESRLRRTVSQGEAAARLLTAEAVRLRREISRADSADHLLRVGEAAEVALSNILRMEIASLEGHSDT